MKAHGFTTIDAQKPVGMARAIKPSQEIKCTVVSLRVTESGASKLRNVIRPGITENALWAILHQSVIE